MNDISDFSSVVVRLPETVVPRLESGRSLLSRACLKIPTGAIRFGTSTSVAASVAGHTLHPRIVRPAKVSHFGTRVSDPKSTFPDTILTLIRFLFISFFILGSLSFFSPQRRSFLSLFNEFKFNSRPSSILLWLLLSRADEVEAYPLAFTEDWQSSKRVVNDRVISDGNSVDELFNFLLPRRFVGIRDESQNDGVAVEKLRDKREISS